MEIYNELLEIATNRRAIKKYNSKRKIDQSIINKIHEFTNTAPTAVGLEQWRVISIFDKEIKNDISKGFLDSNKNKVNDCSHIQLFISKKEEYFNVDNKDLFKIFLRNNINNSKAFNKEVNEEEVKSKLENILKMDFANNDHNYNEWSIRQAYIALGYMMLSAQSLGVNSTPMEGFDKDELNKILISKGMIKEYETISISLALGYIDDVDVPFFSKKQNRDKVENKFKIY